MSNQNPWGNIGPGNSGGGNGGLTANEASNEAAAQGTSGTLLAQNVGGPTGLSDTPYTGQGWNISDIWGGNNPYGGYKLGPGSFAPQGDTTSFYDQLAQQYAGQNADNIAGANAGAQSAIGAFGANQKNVNASLGALASAAAGNQPSQAQIQQTQGIQQSIAASQALANSARGGPAAWTAAQTGAQGQMASTQQSAIQQGAALRAQEMATARGQYATAAQGAGSMNAQAAGQFGTYGSGMTGLANSTMGAMLGYGQNAAAQANAQENAWNNVVSGATSNNAGNAASATGATIGAIGTGLATMSDVRVKRAIVPIGEEDRDRPMGAYERHPPPSGSASEEMLSQVHPYAFNYKPGIGEDPNARRFGVMAQDLEKTPMGKSIVRDTPIGKHIDVTHAMGAALAGLADLNRRLQRLEGKRG